MAEHAGSEPGSGGAGDLGRVDRVLEDLAADTGAVLRRYPRPGQAVRQVILREHRDDGGSQLEDAVLEADGTLRITGHDQGPRVSQAFGREITSYQWVYVIASDRLTNLVEALGGQAGDDVLALLVAYYQQHSGQLSPALKRSEVGAQFSNWHS